MGCSNSKQEVVPTTESAKVKRNSAKLSTDNVQRNSAKLSTDNVQRNSAKLLTDNVQRNSAKLLTDNVQRNSATPETAKVVKKQSECEDTGNQKNQYEMIDKHARNAPNKVKNSAEELVNYMSSASKDHRILVRGIYVWISENIRYDVEGYFGNTTKAPCDAESVMSGGRSVCEGYANVMELLCRTANVQVKKISGYAKGYGHSAASPITLAEDPNHAWNAVQLEGKWYLIDSTWGAGHIDTSNSFNKKFSEFYFLTDPNHFISTHFPCMDKNIEESRKWQLLPKPISLEEFNKCVKYKPEAFNLGVEAISHPQGYIEMRNEIEMLFKSTGEEENVLSARLMLKDGNMMREQRNATFGYPENGLFKMLIHPPKVGTYKMSIFGQAVSSAKLEGIPEILEYTINCTEVKEKDFEFPLSYNSAGCHRSVLHEPLRGKLPANTEIKFRVSAPHLQNMKVGSTFLDRSGTMFTGSAKTGDAGQQIGVYGTQQDRYSSMAGLYAFQIV